MGLKGPCGLAISTLTLTCACACQAIASTATAPIHLNFRTFISISPGIFKCWRRHLRGPYSASRCSAERVSIRPGLLFLHARVVAVCKFCSQRTRRPFACSCYFKTALLPHIVRGAANHHVEGAGVDDVSMLARIPIRKLLNWQSKSD